MDRTALLEQLKEAERNISEGVSRLARQEVQIVELDREGRESQRAKIVLATLKEMLARHYEDRERILMELKK
ncbi:hypothetical protein [Bradyrhizobium lablabi]|uniref:hypothetical protein n=1 Tax=Bradyrhizobium lablabi TaxID=722472 RepID=UPI001BA9A986|nr:hypothetical protein [Bradyrhizobium lablabi]MBR0695817.1 hypothetical protein [Bradyrhizobium lablabi]